MSYLKSPSRKLSIAFLKALQANNYLSPTGKEYAACEVDQLLAEKLTDLDTPESWSGIIGKHKEVTPPEFWTWSRMFNPKLIRIE